MKRKAILPLVILLSLVAGLWILGRITGALQYYSVASESNAPTFKPGTHFFTTNLKKPLRNDFVAFYRNDAQLGRGIYFFRVVALPGDLVELKDGIVKVNDAEADKGLNLMREYAVTGENKNALLNADPDLISRPMDGDTSVFFLPDKLVDEMGIYAAPYVYPENEPEPNIQQHYGQPWNADQFGPIRVPAQHFFLLGDNRHNALDSRYVGFIAERDVVGTVVGKR